ncbi:arrestin [Hirsutella rhossiliensis]|uniref:Arrestin n=1 Tax=Hirsutella rhossiliensis TaxID=111463 RepID=A0A9P8SN45_9HYPO|nr:arrestin [Hirsutella rhossiliensis]KAH0967505.1 arrestin [Hirsutella rhossiliensis]
MAIRIALNNQPEFYTNLDHVSGRVVLGLNRPEQVGSIVVKLEGEATTALQVPSVPDAAGRPPAPMPGPPGSVVAENHKILYRVQQVFPDDYHSSTSSPYGAFPLLPGEHEFAFDFKLPINNACSDPMAMSRIGGLGSGGGLFGMGGVRVMDGSKQLFLKHVTRTLPPSLTGFPMEAEIRYYIKVTVQRPGLLKENWRLQTGFKFLPIEPPRPARTGQETFARRPFTFRAKSPALAETKHTFFAPKPEKESPGGGGGDASTPSIEMSARLPHPPVFTCNQPIPLRLIAKKLVDCPEQVYLSSFQMDLIGITEVRSHSIYHNRTNRWVVTSSSNLTIPLTSSPHDEVGHELVIPDDLWTNRPLPNTIAPSFVACNLSRRYELEIRLGLSCGKPKTGFLGKDPFTNAQTIFLPLQFAHVDVYSGITPPPELVQAAANGRPGSTILNIPPRLPPRTSVSDLNSAARPQSQHQAPPQPPRPPTDPLYPPQLAPGQTAAPQDDAPPSYDEAMAENLSGPFDGAQARPAYSGVTNENGPSQMPEKSG